MKARVHVTLKSGVLDPQGKAIAQALGRLGFEGVNEVRQGKFIELELAIAGVPMAITYRGNPLTIWLAKRMANLSYICLVNLILDRPVVPEFIQQDCRADTLADEMVRLLTDDEAREEQRTQARRAAELIGLGGPAPSVRAAEIILDVIADDRAAR